MLVRSGITLLTSWVIGCLCRIGSLGGVPSDPEHVGGGRSIRRGAAGQSYQSFPRLLVLADDRAQPLAPPIAATRPQAFLSQTETERSG